jgi:hypothetical protein
LRNNIMWMDSIVRSHHLLHLHGWFSLGESERLWWVF